MSDAKRSMCLPQGEPQDKERRDGAEPQATPACALSAIGLQAGSGRVASGEGRRDIGKDRSNAQAYCFVGLPNMAST